jgi:hypothetical protein
MLDPRLVRVGIEIDGKINWYSDLRIKASGTKSANPTQNDCTVTISGLATNVRDYLLTETSPYNAKKNKPKRLILDAGRVSTGYFRVFEGDIVSSQPSVPPDIDIEIKAKTKNSQAGKIVSVSGNASMKLSTICRRVADDIEAELNFQATDKNIANYSFSGPAIKQVQRLQEAGQVRAFVDDNVLIVKDYDKPVKGRLRVLNMDSGLVGLPKATEKGVELTFLITVESLLGGQVRLESKFNKSLNGDYTIAQLKFDLSTHDDPFFYTASCTKIK